MRYEKCQKLDFAIEITTYTLTNRNVFQKGNLCPLKNLRCSKINYGILYYLRINNRKKI